MEGYWNGGYNYNSAIVRDNLTNAVVVTGEDWTSSNCDLEYDDSLIYVGGTNSVAFGAGTHAMGNNQFAIGKYNVADTHSAFIIGGGTESKRSNILNIDWSGNAQFAGDVKVRAFGAETNVISVVGLKSTLDALPAKKSNTTTTLLCNNLSQAVISKGKHPTIENKELDATSVSLVWGFNGGTAEDGDLKHRIMASNQSMLGGANNRLINSGSSAVLGEGSSVVDSDHSLTAGGFNTITSSKYSLVAGKFNKLESAPYSFVAGLYNQAKAAYQAVVGYYNDATDANNIFMVGNGNSEKRSNAFVVKKSGEVQAKSLTIGNTTLTEPELQKILNFINGIEVGGN
jgi:hypothetical protein